MAASAVRIVCWSPDDPDRIGDINLCASPHVPKLREWADMGGVTGGKWYQVRNVAFEDVGTFAWLARYRLAGGPSIIEGAYGDAQRFFAAIETAMSALARWDVDGYRATRQVIGKVAGPKHLLQLPIALDVLDRFANDAVGPTVSANWCDPGRDDWFVGTVAATRLLTNAEAFLDGLSAVMQPLVGPVRNVVQSVRREIAGWAGRSDEAFAYGASRYCYALAQHALTLEKPVAAVMLTHRSLDLFFLSMCFNRGLATVTTDGPAYVSPDPRRDRVYLLNSYWCLEQANAVTFDTKRYQWLQELNDVRNHLLYAHGTNGAELTWVSTAHTKAGDVVRAILGHDAWRMTAQALFPVVALTPSMLFDLESGIDSYLDEITDLIP